MKRKNFPGRKKQRQIDAKIRTEKGLYRIHIAAEKNIVNQACSHKSKHL